MDTLRASIPVNSQGQRAYEISLGRGVVQSLSSVLPGDARKALIVHPPVLHARAEQLRDELSDSRQVFLAEIPDGEAAKRLEVAGFVWGLLGQLEFGRTDVVIGFGGGATTDLAGFVASSWLRGVPVVHLPTTVLGMVDAAIGGKTGVNTAEGKNLVGTFYAPHAVVVDLDFADSLPENEVRAGLAEVAKCGFIRDTGILALIEADFDQVVDPSSDVFAEVVERAIRVKATVVSDDFTEVGLREILNYGHTLGHAIEHAERYRWRHGAAISIGMVFAAELSRIAAGLSDNGVDRHRHVLGGLGLPLDYPVGRWSSLLHTMQKDKKARGGILRFVLLDAIGNPRVSAIADEGVLLAAYQELSSETGR